MRRVVLPLTFLLACATPPGGEGSASAVPSAAAVPVVPGSGVAGAGSGIATVQPSQSAVASATVSSVALLAPRAPRFLAENPGCAVPSAFERWSWKRVHRVEGLSEKAVILTLDVGARLPNLEKVLDLLRDASVRTTIFLYTGELEKNPRGPEILRRMVADGHELANHTLSHKDLTKLEGTTVEEQLERVEVLVKSSTGMSSRPFFREPYLATNDEVDAIVRRLCFRSIWFTVDTGDWKEGATAAGIEDAVFLRRGGPRSIESGSIFIFHGSQRENLVALPRVIARLREQGFAFLTLGEALRKVDSH